MIEAPDLEMDFPRATAGDIAVNNLQSARQQSWSRFWQEPRRPGIAEYIVEQEQLAVQFLGDLSALDRLGALVDQLARVDAESMRTALVTAQVASMTHRFAEARSFLTQAEVRGAAPATVHRLSLSIDQACGTKLDAVLEARRQMAAESGHLEDQVPLGALLADLREFDEADHIYCGALREYQDVSPFAAAWVCFQLGVLWGELAPETQSSRAARWYQKAIEYLPHYVKARVHLAEIYTRCGRSEDAEALLIPAVATGDPEVSWRLADVMNASGRFADAAPRMQAARSGFEVLLRKHLLAFADHGVEFYSSSGNDDARALQLVSVNVANRPTLRAFEQAYATAVGVGEPYVASEFLAAATKHWGDTAAFRLSPLAACRTEPAKTDPGPSDNGEHSEYQSVLRFGLGQTEQPHVDWP
jgi:tetratricopeptide (TPR) repeat protein